VATVWRYRHVVQSSTLDLLTGVVGVLGERADLDLAVELLLETLDRQAGGPAGGAAGGAGDEAFEDGGALTVLKLLLGAAVQRPLPVQLLQRVQELLLDVLASATSGTTSGTTSGSSRRWCVARACLAMECLASLAAGFATVHRHEDFLQRTLLPLLQLSGGGGGAAVVVKEAARTALARVAATFSDSGSSSGESKLHHFYVCTVQQLTSLFLHNSGYQRGSRYS
jgi:hypothetical protein